MRTIASRKQLRNASFAKVGRALLSHLTTRHFSSFALTVIDPSVLMTQAEVMVIFALWRTNERTNADESDCVHVQEFLAVESLTDYHVLTASVKVVKNGADDNMQEQASEETDMDSDQDDKEALVE